MRKILGCAFLTEGGIMQSRIIVQKDYIRFNQYKIPYYIVRSRRTKKIHVRFKHQSFFELVLPMNYPERGIRQILPECLNLMEKMWNSRYEEENAADLPDLSPGGWVLYLGERLNLRMSIVENKIGKIHIDGNTLMVSIREDDRSAFGEYVTGWMRFQAKGFLPSRTFELAERLDVTPNRITVKSQKTRWGSCSKKKNINLNWRLIMVPPEVRDYVIYHELCHLFELNHSTRFWERVEKYCPQYRDAIQWMNRNHRYLHFNRLERFSQEA